jgi:hypothetical protein
MPGGIKRSYFKKTKQKKQHSFQRLKLKGGNSDHFCTRVVNLVTYDVVDDQKLIFKV